MPTLLPILTKSGADRGRACRREAEGEAGGLYVLATERHESRRIDSQLRGRSGRQGDPIRPSIFRLKTI